MNPGLFRSMSTEPKSDGTTRYRLDVVKSDIAWTMSFLWPNPYIEISLSLDGQPPSAPYVTTTKPSTITPVWDEFFQLKSDDPTSIVSINLRRTSLVFGLPATVSIGSTQLSIGELEELGIFSPDISLDLFKWGKKTAVMIIRFKKEEPSSPPVAKPEIPANIPPELRPDFVPPQHPTSPEKKLQFVGYQSRDISKDQVDGIVRQILARSSGEDSEEVT